VRQGYLLYLLFISNLNKNSEALSQCILWRKPEYERSIYAYSLHLLCCFVVVKWSKCAICFNRKKKTLVTHTKGNNQIACLLSAFSKRFVMSAKRGHWLYALTHEMNAVLSFTPPDETCWPRMELLLFITIQSILDHQTKVGCSGDFVN
jgi:hypothetical protein